MAYLWQPLKKFNPEIIRDLAFSVYVYFHYWKQNLLFASRIIYAMYGTGIYLQGTTIITSFSASTGSPQIVDEKLGDFPPPPDDSGMSLKQPIWHVIVLGVVTFKMYYIYWCYKNWRDLAAQVQLNTSSAGLLPTVTQPTSADLRSETAASPPGSAAILGASSDDPSSLTSPQQSKFSEKLRPNHLASFENCSPHLRALICLLPYVDNYMFFTLALGIAKLQPARNSFPAARPYIWASGLAVVMFALTYLMFLPKAFYLLFLLSVIPMAFTQHALNRYWDSVEKPRLITRHGFTFKELVVIIFGALYLGFILSSFLLMPGK